MGFTPLPLVAWVRRMESPPCDVNTPPAPRGRGTVGQIECFEYLHDLLVRFHLLLPVDSTEARRTWAVAQSPLLSRQRSTADVPFGGTSGLATATWASELS